MKKGFWSDIAVLVFVSFWDTTTTLPGTNSVGDFSLNKAYAIGWSFSSSTYVFSLLFYGNFFLGYQFV